MNRTIFSSFFCRSSAKTCIIKGFSNRFRIGMGGNTTCIYNEICTACRLNAPSSGLNSKSSTTGNAWCRDGCNIGNGAVNLMQTRLHYSRTSMC